MIKLAPLFHSFLFCVVEGEVIVTMTFFCFILLKKEIITEAALSFHVYRN